MPTSSLPRTPAPRVSFIIPHHNRPDLLNDLLAGVPDRPDVEILVIDDRSIRLPTVRPFQHARVAVLKTQFPTAGGARNTGLNLAHGEWIVFCDSDDLLVPNALNALIERLPSIDADVVLCTPDSFIHQSAQQGTRHLKIAAVARDIAQGGDSNALAQCVPPWSKFIRAVFLHERPALRFSHTPVSNDVAFNVALTAAKPRVLALPDVFYLVRQGNDSLTGKKDFESLRARVRELNAANATLRAAGLHAHQAMAAGYALSCLKHHPKRLPALLREIWGGESRLLPRSGARWRAWFLARGAR